MGQTAQVVTQMARVSLEPRCQNYLGDRVNQGTINFVRLHDLGGMSNG
jgi:hypothetical protein